MVSTVTTSGVVSATGFVGDGFTGMALDYQYQPNGGINGIYVSGSKTAIGDTTFVSPGAINSTAIGFGAQVDSPNTIQLGNTMVSTVTTSGIVSATGFVGDGSELTNINLMVG